MYIVSQYTADPTLAEAVKIKAVRYIDRRSAYGIAKAGSEHGYYMAINLDDGEQIAGFWEGKQVQGY